ncbi:MAG TPA: hypothetical protein DCY88_32080, partial [Cyanobacteria bacterium UBA11372]|nr:hypothetical protein [Cyanobacteria bacterium UBA11372]
FAPNPVFSPYSGLQVDEGKRYRESLCSGTLKGARTPLWVYLIRLQFAISTYPRGHKPGVGAFSQLPITNYQLPITKQTEMI